MLKSLTAAFALICLPIVALAGESWTVETSPGSGSWIDNPNCTGQCAQDREAARDPGKPKPGAPEQIPGDKPKDSPRLTADRGGRTTGAPSIQHYGFCCIHEGRPRFHPQWLRDKEQARAQCAAKLVKPTCHPDISAQIRASDAKAAKEGGE